MPKEFIEFDPNKSQPTSPATNTVQNPDSKQMTSSQKTTENSSVTRRDLLKLFGVAGVSGLGIALGVYTYHTTPDLWDKIKEKIDEIKKPKPTPTSIPTRIPTVISTRPPFSSTPLAIVRASPTQIPISRPTPAPAPPPTPDRRPTPTPGPEVVMQRLYPRILPTSNNRALGFSSLEEAKRIMNEDFFGPEEIRRSLGISVNRVPEIPFDSSELLKAKELNQFLVYRTGTANDGEALSVGKLAGMLQKEFTDTKRGAIINRGSTGYLSHKPVQPKWALVTKELLEGAINEGGIPSNPQIVKDLLTQTQALATYIKNQVFKDQSLPQSFNEAFAEFDMHKFDIYQFSTGNSGLYAKEGFQKLNNLKLNQIARHYPSELLYDLLVYEQIRNQRLLLDTFAWVFSQSPDTCFVNFGRFNPGGLWAGPGIDAATKQATQGVLMSR